MKTKLRGLFKTNLFVMVIFCYLTMSSLFTIFIRNLAVRRKFYAKNVSFFSKVSLWMMNIKVDAHHLPTSDQHYLIVSNHLGMLDILVLASLRPALFITSVDMQQTPGLGLLTDMGGCLYVERRNRSNIHKEIEKIREALKQGYNVVLFPEATSTNGEKVYPFKKTLMTAVAGTGIPIQPVVINYRSVNGEPMSHKWRDHVFWYGDQTFPPALWRLLSTKSVVGEVEFLKPIHCHSEEDRHNVASHAYDQIVARFQPIPVPQDAHQAN